MLLGGAVSLAAHADELNALNVFPVADGDTGTNMLRTLQGGIEKIPEGDDASLEHYMTAFSRGVLLSARGNSGVILSQIFAGISEGLGTCDCADAKRLAEAYRNGIRKSYAAVRNPTEGTILTVFRESTEYAAARINENSCVEDFFKLHIDEARRSLATTKERLSVLSEADVIDSGAAGYCYIAEGMYQALTGHMPEGTLSATSEKDSSSLDIDRFTRDSVLEFGYCTEFLLRLMTAKVDPDTFDIGRVLNDLQALQGESVVAYLQEDILKVHVHTFHPGKILNKMQDYGEFLSVKIENMSLGHTETSKKKNHKSFSVVAVASGEGMTALFERLGADRIVSGGQTANPAVSDFLDAFKACDTPNILVLPNNKNILLAARRAAEMYTDAKVYVLETRNLMEGYSALSVITPGIRDMDALVKSAEGAARGVQGGEITVAVRDAVIDGTVIRQGEYMAMGDGNLLGVAATPEEAVLKLLGRLDTDLCEIVTLFTGKSVSAEARATLTETLKEICEDCEIVVYEGGQEVYDYLVAIE